MMQAMYLFDIDKSERLMEEMPSKIKMNSLLLLGLIHLNTNGLNYIEIVTHPQSVQFNKREILKG